MIAAERAHLRDQFVGEKLRLDAGVLDELHRAGLAELLARALARLRQAVGRENERIAVFHDDRLGAEGLFHDAEHRPGDRELLHAAVRAAHERGVVPGARIAQLERLRVEHADEHRDEEVWILDRLRKCGIELGEDRSGVAAAKRDAANRELDECGQDGRIDAFAADVGDQNERERVREAVDVEDVAADREMTSRREIRAADLTVRQRNRFAAKRSLQNFGGILFFLKLAIESRVEAVEQDREQAEGEQPKRAGVRTALELRLRAARQVRVGLRERRANRLDHLRFGVRERFVVFVHLQQLLVRMTQQRRRDRRPPLHLQARILVQHALNGFKILRGQAFRESTLLFRRSRRPLAGIGRRRTDRA